MRIFITLLAVFFFQTQSLGCDEENCPHKDQKHKHAGKHHKMMKHHLKSMDTDKDGKVSENEFTQAHMKRFKEMDADSDGFITKDEMKAAHKKKRSNKKSKK